MTVIRRSQTVQKFLILLPFMMVLNACNGNRPIDEVNGQTEDTGSFIAAYSESERLIKVNQVGYLVNMSKLAIVPDSEASDFHVLDTQTNKVVLSGKLSNSDVWAPSATRIKVADFSELVAPGSYVVKVEGFAPSPPITISDSNFLELHDAVIKAYYFNRASTELTAEYAGEWARPAAHPDDEVLVHASAVSEQRPEGTILSSPKGWYDAGDYNKYIVNSGISTYTLLAAYAHFPNFYQQREFNIPESGNQVPDILDEIMWNLQWMASMQDPQDGGVYHKLTTKKFSDAIMPHMANEPRYVVQKSTAAALNFGATMAKAARVYKDFPEYLETSKSFQLAATNAFSWAEANPNAEYQQPDDIKTGIYGDKDFAGEFAWAAAELFLLTSESVYLEGFNQHASSLTTPSWDDTMSLGYASLLSEGQGMLSEEEYQYVEGKVLSFAETILSQHQESAFRVAMLSDEFVWGSNAVLMNKAFMVLQAYRATSDAKYLVPVTGLLDYVLGKNPLDMSYVTGFGFKSPIDPHHRQSYSDDVSAPIPGFLVGGPHTGKQDGCDYKGDQPATTYVDHWCSYATNEVTINWNAPLVYVLAALHNSQ